MSENTVVPAVETDVPVESTENQTPWYQNPFIIGAAVITTAAAVVGVALARRNGVEVDAKEIVETVVENALTSA